METEARVRARAHSLLAGVAADEVQSLLDAGREVRFGPGEMIFREGEVADGLYLMLAGSVRLSATGEIGEAILAVAHANDVFGEMGVLDGELRSATATAVGVCEAYFLPAEPFLDELERSAPACIRMLAHLTKRLRFANGRLGEMAATTTLVGDHGN